MSYDREFNANKPKGFTFMQPGAAKLVREAPVFLDFFKAWTSSSADDEDFKHACRAYQTKQDSPVLDKLFDNMRILRLNEDRLRFFCESNEDHTHIARLIATQASYLRSLNIVSPDIREYLEGHRDLLLPKYNKGPWYTAGYLAKGRV